MYSFSIRTTERTSGAAVGSRKQKVAREFNPSKYSTRLIALKFAYLGKGYNGYEYAANNTTPLPTVEEVLWKALMKACLIYPSDSSGEGTDSVNWNGCEYSKCGRTDRGVSAFGQVIGIRVRSNRPPATSNASTNEKAFTRQRLNLNKSMPPIEDLVGDGFPELSLEDESLDQESSDFDSIYDEIPYPQVLNRLLPADIRVLAWCPTPPSDFSARFCCQERQYRYFFTQPAFNPTSSPSHEGAGRSMGSDAPKNGMAKEGWLDIEAMKDAAERYKGLHDFRNLCKIDASKQITDFKRRIFVSEIQEVAPASEPAAYVSLPGFSDTGSQAKPASGHKTPKIYMFTLHGSAFLWHQVRHMIAILFLIGQRLESPDLVDRLMDAESTPQRPAYEMASGTPLVLWDCIFPREDDETRQDAMEWIYAGDEHDCRMRTHSTTSSSQSFGKAGVGGLVDDMWTLWHERKMDEILAGTLLNLTAGQGSHTMCAAKGTSKKVYQGGNGPRTIGRYIPILERQRMDSVKEINRRYATKKALHLEAP